MEKNTEKKFNHKSAADYILSNPHNKKTIWSILLPWVFEKVLGEFIYFNNHGEVDGYRAIGVARKYEYEHEYYLKPIENTEIAYLITTNSCWTFNIRDYGRTWVLDYDEAERKWTS